MYFVEGAIGSPAPCQLVCLSYLRLISDFTIESRLIYLFMVSLHLTSFGRENVFIRVKLYYVSWVLGDTALNFKFCHGSMKRH